MRARSTVVMAQETRRPRAQGILDEHGNVLSDALPDDTRSYSKTGVET